MFETSTDKAVNKFLRYQMEPHVFIVVTMYKFKKIIDQVKYC